MIANRAPTDEDHVALAAASKAVAELDRTQGDELPGEPLPPIGTLGFRVQLLWGSTALQQSRLRPRAEPRS